MLNDDLFGQSYTAIQKAVFSNTAANFQMLGAPIAYNFMPAGPNQIDPQTYQIVSQMPVWSALGDFSNNGTTLFSAYRQLLSNVTFKVDPSRQADLQQQQAQINNLQSQLLQAQANATQAYNVAKANGGDLFLAMYPTISAWLSGPGAVYVNQIQELTTAVNKLNNKYANDLADILGGNQSLHNALMAIQVPDGTPSSGVAKAGWIAVADSGGVLRWQPEFVISQSPSDVQRTLSQGTIGAFSVSLTSASSSSSLSQSWAGGSASYGGFFWRVGGSGGWEKLDIADDDKSVQVQISVKSSMLVPVNPGVWYDGGFLRNLALNNSASGYQLASGWTATGTGSSVAFGKNGLVSTDVAALVVVYQPSVEVTFSQSTYQRNYQKIQASAGLSIGPFSFGGSGGSVKNYTLSTNGSTTFKASSTSTYPLLIGVGVGFPGIGQLS